MDIYFLHRISLSSYMTAHTSGSVRTTFIQYGIGFVGSLLTTLFAFWAAFNLGTYAVIAIMGAALIQTALQLIFFLHLKRSSPRSWLITGGFIGVIIIILMGGTLWIMFNLSRLHHEHAPMNAEDLYEDGVITPANELL
jgi:cytochrome o ubiquinol oxidase subunit IV